MHAPARTHVHSPTDCHNLVAIRSKTEHPYRTLLVGQQTNVLERVAMETVHTATVGAKGNILPGGSNAGILQGQVGANDPFHMHLYTCDNSRFLP